MRQFTVVCPRCRATIARKMPTGRRLCVTCGHEWSPAFVRGCTDKRRYSTREDAEARLAQMKAKPMRLRRRDRLNAYRCWTCGGWHVGRG